MNISENTKIASDIRADIDTVNAYIAATEVSTRMSAFVVYNKEHDSYWDKDAANGITNSNGAPTNFAINATTFNDYHEAQYYALNLKHAKTGYNAGYRVVTLEQAYHTDLPKMEELANMFEKLAAGENPFVLG